MSRPGLLEAFPSDKLREALAVERNAGRRVVFTNGVFDLIHPGHIRYLRQAKSFGDVLVVALNSDESTRRLKGPARPLIPETERVKIIAALEMVDYVTVFSEHTPLDIIKATEPDVLVKGGDYILDEIVGKNEVESRGGKVVTVPFIDGKSSSNVIERIVRSAQKPI
ncbi:MAG: D-glycero-beta-D-manno-heptose 1-phosphate adenylyltransferase [Candidatus Sumerlaeaceae bacterium]